MAWAGHGVEQLERSSIRGDSFRHEVGSEDIHAGLYLRGKKGDHHVWGHHPAPKWSFREESRGRFTSATRSVETDRGGRPNVSHL